MKILISNNLKSIYNEIQQVWLEIGVIDEERNLNFIGIEFPKEHIIKNNFLEITDDSYENCSKIQYRVKTEDNLFKVFCFSSKHKSVFTTIEKEDVIFGLKNKELPNRQANEEDKSKYFTNVEHKIQTTLASTDKCYGTKNLVYYSVYFKGPYLHLLNFSIETLLKHSTEDFDVLIITDEDTKKYIEELSFVETKKPLYHLTSTPFDGVDASINKLKIFEFEYINHYKNILYLDCDTISIGDTSSIFKADLLAGVLYTAYNDHVTFDHFKTVQHGFPILGDNFVKEMQAKNQMPFNAGQFLFKNTLHMKQHFENVGWMIDNWTGTYFFEQCFMNYYFCKAEITNTTILQNITDFIVTNILEQVKFKPKSTLIHFIAPALDGASKLKFLYNFIQ